jgi:molecular chaperone DnaK
MIRTFLNAPICDDVNPDECVAHGAAVTAVLVLLEESQATGREILPAPIRNRFSGADGTLMKITDLTTHTLGVVLWDDAKNEEFVFPMIPKSTPIPAARTDSFTLSKTSARSATVRIVEGESTLPSQCSPIGTCKIEFPHTVQKGDVLEITYQYNRDQVLEVIVRACNSQQRVRISRAREFSDAEFAKAENELRQLVVV